MSHLGHRRTETLGADFKILLTVLSKLVVHVYLILKVGSCPTDDKFVQILFCPFLCSI